MTDEMRKKNKVRSVVKKALKTHTLHKRPCLKCGDLNAEAHHEDYDQPLEVMWLCRTHHLRLHLLTRKKKVRKQYPKAILPKAVISEVPLKPIVMPFADYTMFRK